MVAEVEGLVTVRQAARLLGIGRGLLFRALARAHAPGPEAHVMKAQAQDLAALARAARRAPLDTDALVIAFVAGILARGPIEPEALRLVLEAAGIGEHRWHAAASAFDAPAWMRRRPHRRASDFVARLIGKVSS
jgi:hypothetical protein